MDREFEQQPREQASEEPDYNPRPLWQVWCARIGLVLFLFFMYLYTLRMARGGL